MNVPLLRIGHYTPSALCLPLLVFNISLANCKEVAFLGDALFSRNDRFHARLTADKLEMMIFILFLKIRKTDGRTVRRMPFLVTSVFSRNDRFLARLTADKLEMMKSFMNSIHNIVL